MPVTHITIDGSQISSWHTFYKIFAETFGFPAGFGRNMDAWIDCMTNLDEEFSQVQVAPGELICITIIQAATFKARCPEQYQALLECSAFVNLRRLEIGEPAILVLAFDV